MRWLVTCLIGLGVVQAPVWAQVVPDDPATIISRADLARIKGSENAPVRIVEVSDFQCPFCLQHDRETFPALDSLYIRTGKVQYVFVGFPNPNHQHSWGAIKAAYCAGAVGKFWQMRSLLFTNQPAWSKATDPTRLFQSYAEGLGIDGKSYLTCLNADATAPLQVKDLESVLRAGISSTPFFVIADSVPIAGAAPLKEFRDKIDAALKRAADRTKGSNTAKPH